MVEMDYPEAFKICELVPEELHHPDCSWRKGILCDCEVLRTHPRHKEDYPDFEITWETYGSWVKGKWKPHKSKKISKDS